MSETFAVCVSNESYPVSLEVGRRYRVIPDQKAEKRGMLRVVDEGGESYIYSAERFKIEGVRGE